MTRADRLGTGDRVAHSPAKDDRQRRTRLILGDQREVDPVELYLAAIHLEREQLELVDEPGGDRGMTSCWNFAYRSSGASGTIDPASAWLPLIVALTASFVAPHRRAGDQARAAGRDREDAEEALVGIRAFDDLHRRPRRVGGSGGGFSGNGGSGITASARDSPLTRQRPSRPRSARPGNRSPDQFVATRRAASKPAASSGRLEVGLERLSPAQDLRR